MNCHFRSTTAARLAGAAGRIARSIARPTPCPTERLATCLTAAACLIACLLTFATAAHAIPAIYARHPALSPDGRTLAFDWRGDIWVVPAEGGRADRLTAHIAHDAFPHWSPDGKEIAFSSDRNGNWDLFVLSLESGAVDRLTSHSDDDYIYDWSPDGATLYFGGSREARDDLVFAVPRTGGLPTCVVGDMAYNASVSPDGRWITYVRGYDEWWRKHYRGPASRDIWVRSIDGGESYLITPWEGDDDRPQWSADSRSLLFQSERADSTLNLYRVGLTFGDTTVAPAGAPIQLTHMRTDGVRFLSLSRDGRLATFECMGEIYVVATTGGEPRKVAIDCPGDPQQNEVTRRILTSGATEYAFAPGEKQIAFIDEGELYAGVIIKDELKEPVRLTYTEAREKDVTWLDEETLLYASDRSGNDDIFAMRSTDKNEPRLGRSRYREEIPLANSPDTERRPQPSPDGKNILYQRDTRFMWIMDRDGANQELLLDQPGILHSSWSPNSRYIAFSRTTLGYAEDIFILDRDTAKLVNVTNHPNDDFHPLWTGDGKRLSWASRTADGFYNIKYAWLTREEADKSEAARKREQEREDEEDDDEDEDDGGDNGDRDDGNGAGDHHDAKAKKEIPDVKIDWDDFTLRTRTVVTVRGYYWDYDQSPDGKHYALRTDAVEKMELWTVDWDGNNLRRMTTTGANPDRMLWNEENDKVHYLSGGQIMEIKNEVGAEPKTYGFSVEITNDAAVRRLQKIAEAWRLLDDGFYDPNFHGFDWHTMLTKYEPLAAQAIMREDWNDVARQMIGELSASHLGVYGPWQGGGDETGRLGFTPDDSYTGPGVRVADVLPHGPLDHEGRRVMPSDVILAIDGNEIAPREEYFELLNHKVDKEIDLTVARGGPGGNKEKITIEPVSGGKIWDLSYEQWMDENRRYVEQLSDGKLGYVHMSAMGGHNWDQFIEDVFSKAKGKQGLILDVRFNNGGSIHDQVLDFLSRRPYAYSKNRGARDITYDAMWRWDGPIVLLTNERSYSDGEIFPAGFKQLGLGRIVGMPTFGAVIGTNDVQLIDGTGFRVPGTGWFMMDGTPLENHPVQPDVLVPDVPEENLRNRDAQIEAGVRECLEMLARREGEPQKSEQR
jgi:tricorn protease